MQTLLEYENFIRANRIREIHHTTHRLRRLSCAMGLMAYALRCDPDAILNGEIRDLESAITALKAAMTGHLLMTTLHANDGLNILDG